ncbi:hypothetical protein [Paenibacillus lautus]|uniref:hypothetical protein n=1 Tax=Paenibacillus lautus TaxID=1401 RepID=UPI003D9A5FE1
MVATVADTGLVLVMLWLISELANWTLEFWMILLIVLLAGIFEYFGEKKIKSVKTL